MRWRERPAERGVSLVEILRVAVAALRAHKLRTFLTLLGVILGVMTVVSVVSVISGLNAYVAESFAILTPELFIVSKFGIIRSREEFLEARKRRNLTEEDLEAVARECHECAMVGGQIEDKEADVPRTAYQKAFGGRRSLDIFVRAASAARVPLAQDEVRAILRARRHTPFRGKDPFGIVTGEAILTIWKSITIGLFAVMVIISGISLVVGGIVIANIMLVSVTERTREIGIRMALGARKRHVLVQFLLEAALMASLGGAIGIGFGAGIAGAVSALTPFPTRVTPFLVVMSLGVAAGVGLISGLAPSLRAANLPPVEALRSE